MDKILAIDPGETTGIVALDGSKVALAVYVSASVILDTALLQTILAGFGPDTVAIEATPGNYTNSQLSVKVYHRIIELTAPYKVKLVNPGLWKPITGKRKPVLGDHIADAYGLAIYVQAVKERNDR